MKDTSRNAVQDNISRLGQTINDAALYINDNRVQHSGSSAPLLTSNKIMTAKGGSDDMLTLADARRNMQMARMSKFS